jgi:outer membrane protein OmpA-like peptidoglycan-associated protein
MARIARSGGAVAGVIVLVAATAGCHVILGAPAAEQATTAPTTLTLEAIPSMLVAVTGPARLRRLISQVVTATARPREDLDILQIRPRRALIASTAPAPAVVAAPGKPTILGRGASSYQEGQYRDALKRWRVQVAAARHSMTVRTRAAVLRWAHSLRVPAALAASSDVPGISLSEACDVATSAVSGLVNQAGRHVGSRRIVLLAVSSLAGKPPTGELDGDDVIVLTSYLPSAAAASAAQVNLLAAGARRASVLGPEATGAQVDQIVSEGLSEDTVTEALSGRALFANDSAQLLRSAAAVLSPLIGPLRRPGASAVINGYASATGGRQHNRVLSFRRASAVAAFLQARGVSQAALFVVGHGATNFVASGSSADNRRVVVVIQEAPGTNS